MIWIPRQIMSGWGRSGLTVAKVEEQNAGCRCATGGAERRWNATVADRRYIRRARGARAGQN
jgi:hypothetical protein